jgi:cytochrome c oxidase subunit II
VDKTNSLWKTFVILVPGFIVTTQVGCSGPQSALDAAGEEAQRIATLFWWMTAVATVIWVIVAGLAVYAVAINTERHNVRTSRLYIIGGGVVAPTLILTVLATIGLAMIPGLVKTAPPDSLKIRVRGAQWWWRVEYQDPNSEEEIFKQTIFDTDRSSRRDAHGTKANAIDDSSSSPAQQLAAFETANEIRIPVNRPVQFYLESEDVIHSFWIPALGGKIDMIPGRQTRLALVPRRTGIFRGVCAEYCGDSHAWMSFYVIVMEQDEFDQWYTNQLQTGRQANTTQTRRGQQLFMSTGCGACHTIRGIDADGTIGPDLTHVGSRVSIAAGAFTGGQPGDPQTDQDDFYQWIKNPEHYKSSVNMPSFDMLSDSDLKALAAYLKSLE